MNCNIEVSDDMLYDDAPPSFCVSAERVHPYYDDSNYGCTRKDDAEILRASTIELLYEQMGELVVEHLLYGERQHRDSSGTYPKDGWEVEFSNIFVEVAYYSVDKMRASKKFQEIGIAREIKKKQEEENRRIEQERHIKWMAEQKEKHDKEEYERLCRKFGNS